MNSWELNWDRKNELLGTELEQKNELLGTELGPRE
jgi:hypothetical protein